MCETKRCGTCGEVKPVVEFSRNKSAGDGLQYSCKRCAAEYQQANKAKLLAYGARYKERNWDRVSAVNAAYYARNRIEILEKQAAYGRANPELLAARAAAYYAENKERISAHHAKRYLANPERWKVHNVVRDAIKAGILEPAKACDICGSTRNLEYHHPDYSKPLEVVPLCRSCHKLLHTGVRQLPSDGIEGRGRLP